MAKNNVTGPVVPKKRSKGTALSTLIGLLSLLLGSYSLAEHYSMFKLDFNLPALTLPIALVICGMFLIKESSHRSLLSGLKRRYETYI